MTHFMNTPMANLTPGLEFPRPGRPLPGFTLPDTSGGTTRLWSFKQRRALLLAFVHGAECAPCCAWLADLAAQRTRLAELDAAVLVVAPTPLERLRLLQASRDLPFTFLSDAASHVAAAYVAPATSTSEPGVALYAADRYLQCLGVWQMPEASGFPPFDAPLTALVAAGQEDCGCGVPSWPEEQEQE